MMKSAVTISLVPEARGGPFVFWDDLAAGCASAARVGFDGVEVFPPGAGAVDPAVLGDLLRKHSLQLAAMGTGAGWVRHKLRLTDPDPSVRSRACEFITEIIDLAGRFQAPTIIGSMQGRWGDGVSREQALAWLAEALTLLGAHAAQAGVPLLYEPLNRFETNLFNTVGAAHSFLRESGLHNVKLLCDLFHMNIEEADIAGALRVAGSAVGHVHFADSNRHAAGFGHTDMKPIIQVLQDIGFQGFLSAEILPLPDSETAAEQTIQAFRQWTR